jgi:uncharacterized membrane protein YfcA
MENIWIYCLLALISGVMKVGFGFGAGLFLNPILTLFMSPTASTSMLSPILWYSNLDGFRAHIRNVRWRLVFTLLPFTIAGTVLGSVMLVSSSEKLIKHGLAFLAITLTILAILQPRIEAFFAARRLQRTRRLTGGAIYPLMAISLQSLIAVISGFVGSTANSGGLPLSFLFIFMKMPKIEYTSNLIALLAITDTVKIISFYSIGILSVRNFLWVMLFIPIIYVGGYLGKWIHQKLEEKTFFALVHCLVILISIILLL